MKFYYDINNDINNAIKILHYRYGKGDVISIYHSTKSCSKTKFTLTAKCTSDKLHTITGVIIANGDKKTIKIYRRQMTIKLV